LLEVGCGIGDFVAFAQEHGFIAVGTEPAAEAAQEAAARGLTVHNLPLQRFAARFPSARFDVVVMINVLEHLPNAVQALHTCKQVLKPKGILCIHVPNDFSQMQVVATEKLGIDPWWIAFPDHINYFDFESLRQLLDRLEFETIHAQATFPMEMFLLMGENYVGNRDVGNGCHMRRVQFEMSVPPELRRKIYTALASVGVGRTCLVFGRQNAS
jgi:2-polyprenyl-3-methyl-5-hydroxy-6-metoxy-1,4-benzoquinol methylase